MTQPTDRAVPHQTLDALIAEAHRARQVLPTIDRCRQLDRALRAELGDLILAAQEAAAGYPERSRDWYRLDNLLHAAEDALAGNLGSGLLSAAVHVGELARQAQALRDAVTP